MITSRKQETDVQKFPILNRELEFSEIFLLKKNFSTRRSEVFPNKSNQTLTKLIKLLIKLKCFKQLTK